MKSVQGDGSFYNDDDDAFDPTPGPTLSPQPTAIPTTLHPTATQVRMRIAMHHLFLSFIADLSLIPSSVNLTYP